MAALKQSDLAILLLLATNGVGAQEVITPQDASPALGGYSPVSYFEHEEPRLGSPKHQATHDGTTYYFTSGAQRERFLADPERYAPLFPYHCPYNLALGRAASIDPTNFRIVADRLLLFHRSEEMDGLEKWNHHGAAEKEELLERARGNFKLIEF